MWVEDKELILNVNEDFALLIQGKDCALLGKISSCVGLYCNLSDDQR